MDKIDIILNNIRNDIPFSLARFNDGEMMGIERVGAVVARGDQQVNQNLHNKLIEAITYEQPNYWKGLPCPHCFPVHAQVAQRMVRSNYPHLTKAVVLTNRNWKTFTTEFPQLVEDKILWWVSGDDQDLNKLNEVTGLKPARIFSIPTKNGWSVYKDIKHGHKFFNTGDIVILSCGPMSRVLAKEWFQQRPDVTFIDVGAVFDCWTRNVWLNCHTGKVN